MTRCLWREEEDAIEVSRLQVAFEATGQAGVQNAIQKTDRDIKNLADNSVRGAGRMSGAFAGAGKAVMLGFGALATIGIGRAVGGFLSLNAQAETLKTTLDIATGSMEKSNAVFAEMKALAAATPFELPELVGAAARIEAFGLSSRKVMGVIGDTAAGTNRGIDQVTNAYLDAGMGQFIRLQELGIDAATVGDKVVLKWVENGKTLSESVDKNNGQMIQSTIAAIWNRKYEGAMKKQSKTFNGMLSTFKDNVRMNMMDATKSIFNFSKDGLDAANRFFDRFADKRAMGLGVWAAAMSSLQTTLDQVFGKTAGGAIIGVIRGIGSAVSSVVGAIGELGGALVSGDISGFFTLLGQDILALAKTTVFKIPSIVVDVLQWAKGAIPDVWEWLKGLIGNRSQVQGDGTGGPEPGTRSIPIGQVLVDVAGLLAGNIAGWAADTGAKIQTWIDSHKPGSFVTAIDLSDFNVAFAAGTEGNWDIAVVDLLKADPIKVTPEIDLRINNAVENWVRSPNLPDMNAKWLLVAPIVFANLPFALGAWAAKNVVPDIGKVIRDIFTGAMEGLFTGPKSFMPGTGVQLETLPGGGLLSGLSDDILAWFQTSADSIEESIDLVASGLWTGVEASARAAWEGLGTAITGTFDSFVNGKETFIPGMGGGTISGAGIFENIIQSFKDGFEGIKSALTIDLSGIPIPGLPGWMSGSMDWINGPINVLEAAWSRLVSLKNKILKESGPAVTDPFAFEQDPTFFRPGLNYRPPDAAPPVAAPVAGEGTTPPVVGTPVSLLYTGPAGEDFVTYSRAQMGEQLKGLFGGGASASSAASATFKTTFDADTGPAAKAYTSVMKWGQVFQKTVFTSKFAIDLGLAAKAYTDAFSWGGAWARSLFTSTFSINNGPAAVAYTNAFGWGYAWAGQVFTARFSVDTSGLWNAVAVARVAAQQIRDLMPSSPAKKGPLSTPITFDYIADSMAATMSRMGPLARSGMAGVAGYMSPDVGASIRSRGRANARASQGGDTYIIDLKDSIVTRDAAQYIQGLIERGVLKIAPGVLSSKQASGRG